jgi:hypothetical protein
VFLLEKAKKADTPGVPLCHFGTRVATALDNKGSGKSVKQMNRMRPRPQKGQRWRKGVIKNMNSIAEM